MLKKLMDFANSREMRESRDEMVVGEIVLAMAQMGMPAIGFVAGMDAQSMRFATPSDNILNNVGVVLDRKTGGGAISDAIIGSKAVVTVVAEVKNYLADPDDLVNMWKTDFANITRMPMLGQVKLDHQLNSVFATKKLVVELKDLVGDQATRQRLVQLLQATLDELRNALAPHKKASAFEIQE